uniref:Uncharacterized protein n=1 Tax=Arundo donax TaxID=35708 RepID=A0A0A8YSN1_ARUDO
MTKMNMTMATLFQRVISMIRIFRASSKLFVLLGLHRPYSLEKYSMLSFWNGVSHSGFLLKEAERN